MGRIQGIPNYPGRHVPRAFDTSKLATANDWIHAAQQGKVGFRDVMSHEDKIPSDRLDEVVAACQDAPGF